MLISVTLHVIHASGTSNGIEGSVLSVSLDDRKGRTSRKGPCSSRPETSGTLSARGSACYSNRIVYDNTQYRTTPREVAGKRAVSEDNQ